MVPRSARASCSPASASARSSSSKTWGVLALGAAGALMVTLAATDLWMGASASYALRPALGGALLCAAAVPFLAPMLRYVALARVR